jgi:hypothetical protein
MRCVYVNLLFLFRIIIQKLRSLVSQLYTHFIIFTTLKPCQKPAVFDY